MGGFPRTDTLQIPRYPAAWPPRRSLIPLASEWPPYSAAPPVASPVASPAALSPATLLPNAWDSLPTEVRGARKTPGEEYSGDSGGRELSRLGKRRRITLAIPPFFLYSNCAYGEARPGDPGLLAAPAPPVPSHLEEEPTLWGAPRGASQVTLRLPPRTARWSHPAPILPQVSAVSRVHHSKSRAAIAPRPSHPPICLVSVRLSRARATHPATVHRSDSRRSPPQPEIPPCSSPYYPPCP